MRLAEGIQYFETVAKNHKKLLHGTGGRATFRRINVDEALNDLGTTMKHTTMLLEKPTNKMSDALSDNPRKLVTWAFWIITPVKPNDFDAEIAALEECEAISEQVLAKIRNDAKKTGTIPDYCKPIKGFEENSVTMLPVTATIGSWKGYRTEVTFNSTWRNNLVLSADDWVNETSFKDDF